MALNFNVSPYYDDFDPNKNFHRILFKPGFAVQARELTQSQTILQDQISKFADHIFQKNTPISGAKLTYNTAANYIKLESTYNNAEIDVTQFSDLLIQNQEGDVIAKVLEVVEASDITGGDPNTLVVSYISGGQFKDGDVIYSVFNPNLAVQALSTNSTGSSSVVSISEGVFYVVNGFSLSQTTGTKYSIGHFVNVLPQTTILDKYGITPNLRIGLNVIETITDYVDDVALLDPADGAPNYQGPGADRYTIRLDLETRPLSLGDDSGFIELMQIENGQIKKQVDGTVYSTIDDYFAKRTFDTNGDYIVNDFKLTPSANADVLGSDTYELKVGKGIAYVRGYRLENQSEISITADRARETDAKLNDSTFINYGNFVYTNTANGFFDYSTMPAVDLHLVASPSVVTTNTKTYNSSVVATARIRGLEIQQESGATSTYVYRTYLTDIENKTLTTTAGASSNTTSVYLVDDGKFSSVNDSYKGVSLTITTNGVTEHRKVTSYKGATKYVDLDNALVNAPTVASSVSLNFVVKDVESIIQSNKVSAPYKVVANSEISVLSKDNGVASGNTFISETVSPELIYSIGYPYISGITGTSYSTNRTFKNQNFGSTSVKIDLDSGDPFTFLSTSPSDYIIINNANGKLGSIANVTSITLSGDEKSATLNYSSLSDLSSINATVVTKISVGNADDDQWVLKVKNLIEGDTASVHITGTTVNTNTKVDTVYGHVYILKAGLSTPGQSQSLYMTDVKRIVKIIDTGSGATPAINDMLSDPGYDITNNFTFDNGQRDSYYAHASIKLKPGKPIPVGNMLVILDYYDHDTNSGDGYFSVRSYLSVSDGGVSTSPEQYEQIPSYTSKNGTKYSLRDCLDFRPKVQNAQSDFLLEVHNNTIFLPVNKDIFKSDYDYYLARKDLLVLSKDRNFEVIKGTADINPLFPSQPDGSLLVAKLTLDPYTAYVPGEAPRGVLPNLSFEKVQHKRWRMQDISDLQVRVNNIEYYTALNSLEKNAQSLQIPDVNGLNRFKNGILVDDFSSFATADTNNSDFNANINRREKKLTAAQLIENYPLQSSYLLKTANSLDDASAKNAGFKVHTIGATNYFTLPYTSANLASQVLASNVININPFSVAVYSGTMTMNPPMDNWVDNAKQPDLLIVDPDLQIYQSSNTLNTLSVGDWKTIPGTTTTKTSSSSSVVSTSTAVTTTTSSTTQTYASLSQLTTLGYYDKLGSTYNQNGGYITDISILPYIRPQQILVRAKGLLINTPLKTWFDGSRVDNYMSAPDIIELSGVYGTFKEDDTIGYTYESQFFPVAKIAGIYKYPDPTKVRLYVFGNYESNWNNVTKIQNVTYNTSGVFVGNTAFGTPVTTNQVISVHKTGFITSVGNNTTDINNISFKFYKKVSSRYGTFNNKYGIWSTNNGSGQYLTPNNVPANFRFNVPKTGTYYVKIGAEWAESSEILSYQVYDSSNNVISFTTDGTNTKKATLSLPQGTSNISFRFAMVNGADNDSFFALAISSSAFGTGDNGTEVANTLIFSTDTMMSSNTTAGVTSNVALAGGGIYYTGVTQISLSSSANTTNDFYKNNKIKINSTNVVYDTVSKTYKVTPIVRTANIVSYIGANSTVFLDAAVPVSFGHNSYAGGDITSSYSMDGSSNNHILSIKDGGLAKLSSDESGSFVAVFNLPDGVFKTGERVFRVDNRLLDADSSSSTTYAESTFTSSGLSTKSQAINFSASVDSAAGVFTRSEIISNQLINTSTSSSTSVRNIPQSRDPVCQSFLIEKTNFPNGAFVRSIKLFFASKPTTTSTPITLAIVGTQNGYPNGQVLDNSIVILQSADVKTSTTPHRLDAATYTEFVFKAPVYIQPNTLYAILLQSPSNEYNAYLAAQNAIALSSSVKNLPTDPTPSTITKIGTAPYVGSLFESQNGLTWTADQGKALMFVMDRCVFDTSKSPTLPFVVGAGLPKRKLTGQEIKTFYDANNVSNIFNLVTGNDVMSDAYNLTATDFVPSATAINYTYRSTLKSDKSTTTDVSVSPGKNGCPTYDDIYLNDGKGERVLISNSNSSFVLSSTLSSSDNTVSPIISDDGTSLYNVTMKINNLELSNDSITLIDGGTGYNAATLSVSVSLPDDVDGIQASANVTLSGNVISSVYFTDVGSGYWTTPTITISDDTTRSGNSNVAILVHGETSSYGGNALTKYITKKVVLTPGNDSADLRVYYTAYRPIGTNILVYYKILNRNDSQAFEDSEWQLMTTIGNNTTYSRSRSDLYEFVAAPGVNGVADDVISYTSSNGLVYNDYSQFAIKIVLATNDNTNVPFLTDIRALALPSGSGI